MVLSPLLVFILFPGMTRPYAILWTLARMQLKQPCRSWVDDAEIYLGMKHVVLHGRARTAARACDYHFAHVLIRDQPSNADQEVLGACWDPNDPLQRHLHRSRARDLLSETAYGPEKPGSGAHVCKAERSHRYSLQPGST